MKASSCPNLNRETTSFPNFFTLFQHPDHHHDTTLYKLPKVGHGDDTTLSKSPKTIDTDLSVTSPIKGILSTSLSVNETNENRYRIVGFFPEWDQMDRTLPKGPPSPNGSDARVSVGSNEDIITSVSFATQKLLNVKGVPWTQEEHRLFLLGLQKLRKGDWRGISRSYVTSRTPTQVARHAQKYFIRRSSAIWRKRRLSLFNMVPEMDTDQLPPEEQFMLPPSKAFDTDTSNSFPSLKLYLSQEFEPMETTSEEKVEEAKETTTPSGVPWTQEEHRLFLLGLQKLRKGDWHGISRCYVTSRTPTQVARHAQKYFIRRSSAIWRKRRLSLFNMVPEMDTDQLPPEEQFMLPPSKAFDTDTSNSFPSLKLYLSQEFEPMETTSVEKVEEEAKETTTPSGEFQTADGQK